jgi:hypothetical protein
MSIAATAAAQRPRFRAVGFARPESPLGDSGLAHYYEQAVVVMSPASLCLYQVLPPAYARMQ